MSIIKSSGYAFFAVLPLTFMGCSATMVSTRGDSKSPYAPANETEHPGGMIKYSNHGADSIIRKRRENAYKQMYDFCGGRYAITSEGPRSEGGSAFPVGDSVAYHEHQYWYISFDCQKTP